MPSLLSAKNGKAELAAVAPTAEELSWWKTQCGRYRALYLIRVGGVWGLAPAAGILLRHGGYHSVETWIHAFYSAVFVGGIFGWSTWKTAEPQLCADDVRGRRLLAALARTQESVDAPVGAQAAAEGIPVEVRR